MEATFVKGPPPDLSARFKLKAKYAQLQQKYARAIQVRKDLILEAGEKEAKVSKLQDEVKYAAVLPSLFPFLQRLTSLAPYPLGSLVIDQIYATDYAHLLPADDSSFSDDQGESEAEDEGGAGAGKKGNGAERGEHNGTGEDDEDSEGEQQQEDDEEDDSPWPRNHEIEANGNGTGHGNGLGAVSNGHGTVRKERPYDLQGSGSDATSPEERMAKRARLEGELVVPLANGTELPST